MRIEEIRDKFIKGEKVLCDVCRSEITILGDRAAGRIVSAQCSKNSQHYAVILNSGSRSVAEMFDDLPQKIAA